MSNKTRILIEMTQVGIGDIYATKPVEVSFLDTTRPDDWDGAPLRRPSAERQKVVTDDELDVLLAANDGASPGRPIEKPSGAPDNAALIAANPPRAIFTDAALLAARRRMATIRDGAEGTGLTDIERAYLATVTALVDAYVHDTVSFLETVNRPDSEVLRFLIAAYSPDTGTAGCEAAWLTARTGIPPLQMRLLLAGERALTRDEIARIDIGIDLPSRAVNNLFSFGLPNTAIVPAGHSTRFLVYRNTTSGKVVIRDNRTERETALPLDARPFAVYDADYGTSYFPEQTSAGFISDFQGHLNGDEAKTLRLYFHDAVSTRDAASPSPRDSGTPGACVRDVDPPRVSEHDIELFHEEIAKIVDGIVEDVRNGHVASRAAVMLRVGEAALRSPYARHPLRSVTKRVGRELQVAGDSVPVIIFEASRRRLEADREAQALLAALPERDGDS